MADSDLERTIDAALQDRDWLDLILTDVRENEDELRSVLDRAVGAAERTRSALAEVRVRKNRFAASALTLCQVPVTDSGGARIFRLIFRRRRNEPESAGPARAHVSNGLYLSIPFNPD